MAPHDRTATVLSANGRRDRVRVMNKWEALLGIVESFNRTGSPHYAFLCVMIFFAVVAGCVATAVLRLT